MDAAPRTIRRKAGRMMRYKGKYVALVEIDFDIEKREGVLPFDVVKKKITDGEMTDALRDVIVGEVTDDYETVTVTQQYADMYEVEDDGEAKA